MLKVHSLPQELDLTGSDCQRPRAGKHPAGDDTRSGERRGPGTPPTVTPPAPAIPPLRPEPQDRAHRRESSPGRSWETAHTAGGAPPSQVRGSRRDPRTAQTALAASCDRRERRPRLLPENQKQNGCPPIQGRGISDLIFPMILTSEPCNDFEHKNTI